MSVNGRRKSLVWPLVLISMGVLFLLNNLGVVDWNVWTLLFRMWPVLIVAIGLDLIFGRRSGIWQAITVIVLIGLFAGAFWLFDVTENTWTGEKIVRPVLQEAGDANDAQVNIKMNIGSLMLGALPPLSEYLIAGDVEISEYETLTDDLRISDGSIIYQLSSEGQQYHPGWLFTENGNQDKRWELLLTPNLILDLEVDTGVGKTDLDLSGLELSNLKINSGVGEVSVTLPDFGDYRVQVSAGIGKMEIFFPADIGLRVSVDGGIGSESIIGNFFQEGGYYYSENYRTSEDQVELFIDGGIGNIRVVQIEN